MAHDCAWLETSVVYERTHLLHPPRARLWSWQQSKTPSTRGFQIRWKRNCLHLQISISVTKWSAWAEELKYFIWNIWNFKFQSTEPTLTRTHLYSSEISRYARIRMREGGTYINARIFTSQDTDASVWLILLVVTQRKPSPNRQPSTLNRSENP